MEVYQYGEIFSVVSNLFLLIPAVAYTYYRRIWRAAVFYIETFVSGFFHLCLAFNVCIFSFPVLKFWDYFFATNIVLNAGLYLVHFTESTYYIEWILLIIGGGTIIILQLALPSALYVQAAIVLAVAVGVVIYWVVYANTVGKGKLPPYDWYMLSIGLSLMALSVCLFVVQEVLPSTYWLTHSLWHIAAALGNYYFVYIKRPPNKYVNAASKVGWALRA